MFTITIISCGNLHVLMKFLFRLLARVILVLIVLDLVYIAYQWFQCDIKKRGEIPVSQFMLSYIEDRKTKSHLPQISWQPIALEALPENVYRVFIIAEDTHFFVHHGFDVAAIKSVIKSSLKTKTISRGASTISQQTAKNLFLYPQRSWLRKWHELIFTLLLEMTLEKNRILEIYLNVAEFGQGIYGINAAAQHYLGIPASSITPRQASYLAAALPWPQKHNYKTSTKQFKAHANRIYRRSQNESFPTK